MKKFNIAFIPLMALLVVFLTGCTSEQSWYEEFFHPIETSTDAYDNPLHPISTSTHEDTTALFNFANDLFRQIIMTESENPVISPLSAYFALSMTALGAHGGTLQEMQDVLGSNAHALAREIAIDYQNLTRADNRTTLNLAGSVWITDSLAVDPDFNQAMLRYFNSPSYSRNFYDEKTINEINYWIYKRTNRLLDDVLKEIEPEVIMLLINTLYFSARWASTFYPMRESTGNFYLQSGEAVETMFLSTGYTRHYVSVTEYYEAIFLPYDDGRLGLFLVRPTNGVPIRNFVATHDLHSIINSLEAHHTVRVYMPQIDIEYKITLNEHLQTLGIIQAFDETFSDLLGLVYENLSEPIFISEVLQAIRIIVHSQGTEAAAVTIVMPAAQGMPYQPITLDFNTPYAYMIYDMQTGIVLFAGVVDNPS